MQRLVQLQRGGGWDVTAYPPRHAVVLYRSARVKDIIVPYGSSFHDHIFIQTKDEISKTTREYFSMSATDTNENASCPVL